SYRDSFLNQSLQLSPCDSHLSLSSCGTQFVVYYPKVDEISLFIINTTTNPSVRSIPLFYLLCFDIHMNRISQLS
ncbi:Expp1 protein, partial [Musa troglodytarum]